MARQIQKQPKPTNKQNKTTQLRLETGKQVGELAYRFFPNGRKIEFSSKEQMAMKSKYNGVAKCDTIKTIFYS